MSKESIVPFTGDNMTLSFADAEGLDSQVNSFDFRRILEKANAYFLMEYPASISIDIRRMTSELFDDYFKSSDLNSYPVDVATIKVSNVTITAVVRNLYDESGLFVITIGISSESQDISRRTLYFNSYVKHLISAALESGEFSLVKMQKR
jgi:hypothetical protein